MTELDDRAKARALYQANYYRVRWKKSEDGFCESHCERFYLAPQFNHGTKPWCYVLYDSKQTERRKKATTHYTQASAKAKAQRIIDKEAGVSYP